HARPFPRATRRASAVGVLREDAAARSPGGAQVGACAGSFAAEPPPDRTHHAASPALRGSRPPGSPCGSVYHTCRSGLAPPRPALDQTSVPLDAGFCAPARLETTIGPRRGDV